MSRNRRGMALLGVILLLALLVGLYVRFSGETALQVRIDQRMEQALQARLGAKARAEMRPGGLLVSNSFAIPDMVPEATFQVEDRRRSRLFRYRPAPQ